MLAELENDEHSLTEKIRKRTVELERIEKRLRGIQVVRPAYMDEYERLEEEMQILYSDYVSKYRNLHYLERDLEAFSKLEHE